MQFSKEMMKGVAELLILQVLKENGESYGYLLSKSVHDISAETFELKEGTLYPLLYRLEFQGKIESYVKTAPSGKDRRYYRITKIGEKFLEEKTSEVYSFVNGIKKVFNFSFGL